MGMENSDMREVSSIQNLLFQRLVGKYVTTGDLAAIALARGWAKEVQLVSYGKRMHIGGKFQFNPLYSVHGFWILPTWRRKFSMALPLVSEGLWAVDDKTYVRVGQEKIDVVVNGKAYLSRHNICGLAESIGGGGSHIVVHIVGSVRGESTVLYTAFRCSEWILPLTEGTLFDRFAFSKVNVHNDMTGERVEFREVFIKKGRVVAVLINPSCRQYMDTVYRLYKAYVDCKQ